MTSVLSSISVAPGWLWFAFTAGVFVLLIVDLSLFGRATDLISRRKAVVESCMWIAVALLFNAWFWHSYGSELGLEFLTGYLVEKSLSVDNLFVIFLIFAAFKVPQKYQHRVLFYGVIGAIAMRAFFILVGAQLLQMFHWVLYIFGAILVLTAVKFLLEKEQTSDPTDSWAVRKLKQLYPSTDSFSGHNFFIVTDGVRRATPLFFALVVIELTDLVFAVDSIPAVFAITEDAFVAFASNILAVLGLRALYFVLADWVGRLRYLKLGLAAILAFIGVKMLVADLYKIPSLVSLSVICVILTAAALSSWYVERRQAG